MHRVGGNEEGGQAELTEYTSHGRTCLWEDLQDHQRTTIDCVISRDNLDLVRSQLYHTYCMD